MISNSGHDEHGKYSGGQAGDQTGGEWSIIPWYPRGWNYVLRHPDANVREAIASNAEKAARNNLIGYDQNQRTSYWKRLKASNYDASKITVPCEGDCSAGVAANVKAAGYILNIPALQNVSADCYTGSLRPALKNAGFLVLTDKKYLTSDKYLLRGDILLYEYHHTATNLTNGSLSGATNTTTSTPTASKNYLSKGDSGAEVKEYQEKLIKLGFSCGTHGADGDFGSATDSAVRAFQTQYGLTVDGQIGVNTKAKINALLSSATTTTNSANSNVKSGQKWLNANYKSVVKKAISALLEVDGDYGDKSRHGALAVWKDVTNRKYNTSLDVTNENFGSTCKQYASKYDITVKKGTSGTYTYLAEFILSAKGYYTGKMDAECGSGLVSAIKAFQTAKGLKSDGACGANTWFALFG